MNGFFANLVDRHLGTCETIQPRTPGRFETDNNSHSMVAAVGTVSDITGLDHTLQPSDEFSIADSSTVAGSKSDSIENKNETSPSSSPDKKNHNFFTKSIVTEQHVENFDSHVLPIKSQIIQSLDSDTSSNSETVKRDQAEQSIRVDDKKITNSQIKNDSASLDKVIRDNNYLPTSSNSEHILESELNHRIQTMLKHLTKDTLPPETSTKQNYQSNKNNNIISVLPNTEISTLDAVPADQDRQSRQNNRNNDETLISVSPETKIPLLDAVTAQPERAPVSNRQATREENNFSEDNRIASNQSQLEPPSWFSDMASQLKQGLQEKESKTEPVINVTIGRVEVRAVQTEPSKNARQTKKVTGVMTLEDYLKRREGGGSK